MAENHVTLGARTLWISRMLATQNEVKELIAADLTLQPCEDDYYQCVGHVSGYVSISQKWVVYHSAPRCRGHWRRRKAEKSL
jgi:transposase